MKGQDERFFHLDPAMQTYYPSLEAINQQTLQLESEQCKHCRQTHQLVSHVLAPV